MRYVIDIETASSCDLSTRGVYNYSHDPSTRLLCIAWADADAPKAEPEVWSCCDATPMPEVFERLLKADLLIAHNANFERTVLKQFDPRFGDAKRWACTALLSAAVGRPRSLRDACRSLCFPEELEKDARGKRLLNMFSIESSKLYVGGPESDPKAFNELCEYCRQDVRAERAIWLALSGKFYDDLLRRQWLIDAQIEDAGIPVDIREITGAKRLYEYYQADAEARAVDLTGGVPLRSTVGLRKWTAEKGYALDSFSRSAVDEALANTQMCDAAPEVAELLRLRKRVAGTAGKKFDAFLNYVCPDNRIREILVSRGAHTGRYAGRGVQPQNLPRGFVDPELLDFTRHAAFIACREPRYAAQLLTFGVGERECDALASLCRDAIAAPPGRVFVVADYSAVEARVLAWLAGETWVEHIFEGDGRIYERTAAAMYKKSVDNITKQERMAGKIATLALGYGGGVGALQRFAAAYGVQWTDAQAQEIVTSWRASRPRTTALWRSLDGALKAVVKGPADHMTVAVGRSQCEFRRMRIAGRPVVELKLPSGRAMYYWAPRIDLEKDEVAVEVYGPPESCMPAVAAGATMTRIYGGVITENLTQAVAFDLLLGALLRLSEHDGTFRVLKDPQQRLDFQVVMHIHDEIVVECPEEQAGDVAKLVRAAMETTAYWARGLVLKAAPEIMSRYKK